MAPPQNDLDRPIAPDMSEPAERSVDETIAARASAGGIWPPALYPNAYVWLVFVSAMDVMLTWLILYFNGREVNPLAAAVIDRWGLPGAIVFKFGLMVFVIAICEIVGRMKPRTGWLLSRSAVVISAVPVTYSLILLTLYFSELSKPFVE